MMMTPQSFLASRQHPPDSPPTGPSTTTKRQHRQQPHPRPQQNQHNRHHQYNHHFKSYRRHLSCSLESSSPQLTGLTLDPLSLSRRPDRKPVSTLDSCALTSSSAIRQDQRKDAPDAVITVAVQPVPISDLADNGSVMAKRKSSHENETRQPPASHPRPTTCLNMRTTAPTSPVQIPSKSKQTIGRTHSGRRHSGHGKPSRPNDVHDQNAIPPAMAALLALTDIPRPARRNSRGRRTSNGYALTLEAVIERQQESEKELSLTLGKGPMDLLLSPPEELEDDEDSSVMTDVGSLRSVASTRTISNESVPSLGDSFATDGVSSVGTPASSSPAPVRRRSTRRPRRSLEPVSSPQGLPVDHPLSFSEDDSFDLDSALALHELPQKEGDSEDDSRSEISFSDFAFPLRPLKSAFKSNLTASLRALKSAARSISAINLSSVPPDDFLTRSLLTMDTKVPYTDERRPPVLEEAPSAALRRYLNPTTNARIEAPSNAGTIPRGGVRGFTASIQMQTYKVQRSRSAPPSARTPFAVISTPPGQQSPSYQPPAQSPNQTAFSYPPGGMRQRETRENSDFIRIAVMEMAMRKHGKLDDQRPGRARWTLPPRRAGGRPYEVGEDGVPARWVPVAN